MRQKKVDKLDVARSKVGSAQGHRQCHLATKMVARESREIETESALGRVLAIL